jgi:hypothetical protein
VAALDDDWRLEPVIGSLLRALDSFEAFRTVGAESGDDGRAAHYSGFRPRVFSLFEVGALTLPDPAAKALSVDVDPHTNGVLGPSQDPDRAPHIDVTESQPPTAPR